MPIIFGQVFIYTLFLGVTKGLSTYYISVFFGLHNHPVDNEILNLHLLIRLIPAIILSFWFVPLMSWIEFTLSKYKKLRDELITQTARLELENQSYKKLIEESKQALRKKMQSIFQEIKNELDKIHPDDSLENQWTKIADLVRNAAFYEIRPQSHSLWNSNIERYQNLSIRFFVRSSLRLNPFPWKLVIPLFLITTFLIGVLLNQDSNDSHICVPNSFVILTPRFCKMSFIILGLIFIYFSGCVCLATDNS